MAAIDVRLLVNKLSLLLEKDAHLLRGVDGEVKAITRELQRILAFLDDAQRWADAEGNNTYGIWVEDLTVDALKIENAIDEYTRLMSLQQRQHVGYLRKDLFSIIQLKQRPRIASKVQQLKQKVREISETNKRFHLYSTSRGSPSASSQANTWYNPRKDAFFVDENEVIGFEKDREELSRVLLDGLPNRTVVSVVGMGGVGKTTLARQVYDRVKRHFDCQAWIVVSQSYDVPRLLRSLIKKFCPSRDDTDLPEIEAKEKLRDYLKGRRYLIVFDDVWNPSFWADVQNALPKNYWATVLITTRLVEVANSCKISSPIHIHHLQPLPPEISWELFCQKAFQFDFGRNFPTDLEELSRPIVQRCEGLPLAIVLIAGLLSTRNQNVDECRNFLSSLSFGWESNVHLSSITKILSLSYYDLPHHLKPCFLYFGIFPEGFSIRSGRLIREWIAEGFVCPEKNEDVETVAKGYLAELVNRSLIQVSKTDFDGKPKTCRIHNLMRDMIVEKMRDLSFYKDLSRDRSSLRGSTRRISVVAHSNDAFKSFKEAFDARSIFIFDRKESPNPYMPVIIKGSKFLNLLDLEDNPSLEKIPKDIGKLFHLKYLSLRGTGVSLLPKSIGKLFNLETLDLKYTLVKELPVEIKKLGKLRHLLVCSIDSKVDGLNFKRVLKGAKINKGIGRLKALQKLYLIKANAVEFDVFNEISQLTNLKKLGIRQLRSEDGRRLCDCVQKMDLIECIDVASTSEYEPIDLESISAPLKFLRRLYLHGRLFKLPRWIKFLPSLASIRIRWSKLEEDPLRSLQHLPNLLEIDISYNAYCGEELRFEEISFQKLKFLCLYGLSKFKSLVIEETALPMLETLKIGQCPLMTEVPSGLQHLIHLKEVLFQRMPRDFRNLDFQTLQHVPTVEFIHEDDELMVEFDTSLKILETSMEATRKDRDLAIEGTSTVTNEDWQSENELVHGSDLNIEKPKHDVFLSISSEDTRKNNFTSHLYAALRRNGITTHSYNGTESGDEISPEVVKAIQESRLCLVIFSKYYAVSSWRHNELKHILRCTETRGDEFVVSVYYDVDSSSVKERLEHYQTYFAQKKEKSPMDDSDKEHSSEVVLSKAASLPSWDSNAIRPESKLIEEIVGDIIKKLKRIPPITDFDGLVGIPDRLDHIKSLLDYDSPKVIIIGIEGMGGIGKTAITKVLFDKLSIQFEASCFLGDSKEAWESGRKKYLQKKLVSGGLLGKKVLIVIDDVEEEEQFELLLGDRDHYGAGSRVIVTSRHSRAIKDADSIYRMTELSPSEALLLFKLNAFRKSSFTERLLRLSEALVNSFSNRNPLSIKLVGSVLHGKSSETWLETMGRLRNVSNGEIQNVLRICYDQLEEDAKNVFLDVACFFKGSDEEFVKRILDGCWSGSIKAMKDLLEMSLITAVDSKLRMHDLIEDLGKAVVSEVSVIEPGQRSRLWDAKDIYHVFENDTGTDAVEAIFLDMCKIQKVEVGPTAFSRMSKLRMLKLHSHFAYCTLQFTGGDLQFLSSELRYLYWDAYPFKSMPSSFTGNKLVELRLRFSKVEQLWEITQELENLKVIDLSFSKELIAIPDLSRAGNVESVILSGCKSLSEVPLYFQHLTKLVTLDLEDCSSLEAILALPENIIHVNLARCINLKKLPVEMSELKSLRRLELAGCSSFDFTNFKKFTTSS